MQAEQSETEHHQRESRAVVHAGLAGEREAELVAVAGMADLNVGGEHRVGGRDDRPEQHGGAQRQAEQIVGKRRHQADRHRHRQHGE
jgi:hypothetical protein